MFGRLDFFDGVPRPETVSTAHDALDLMRGIEVFLNAVPGASLVAMRRGLRSAGITSPSVIGFTDPRANSQSLYLTPNTETTYGTTFLDLKEWGPTVIEAPPESLCVVDDFWFRYVADMGIAGPDRGQGGKYLFLPPGYDGDVPDGYFTYQSPTYTNWVVLRALAGVPAIKQSRIYPLSQGSAPNDNEFVNLAEETVNAVHSNDFSFFEELDELVQDEPTEALDVERAGQLAAVGLAHGQPFAPDDRMRAILSRAAEIGAGLARIIAYEPRNPEAALFGSWKNAFVGGSYEFLRNGARLLDARTQFHYLATVITPAMAHAQVGAGSAYAYTIHDRNRACSTGPAPTGCTSTRTHRRRTSGPSTSTTPRPAPCCRSPPRSGPLWPATPAPSRPTTTAPTTSTSAPPPGRARTRTGLKPSPASPGSRYSGSTDPSNHGSTRPGSSTSSSPSTEKRGPPGRTDIGYVSKRMAAVARAH